MPNGAGRVRAPRGEAVRRCGARPPRSHQRAPVDTTTTAADELWAAVETFDAEAAGRGADDQAVAEIGAVPLPDDPVRAVVFLVGALTRLTDSW